MVYPLNAWAAVATRAKSSRSLATIYFLNPAVSNNELLIGDTIGRAPANLRANTIDEAKKLFCKATGTALDFAACSLSSNVGFWQMLLKNSTFAELCESLGSLIVIARPIVPSCGTTDLRWYGELHQPPKVLGDGRQ